MRVKTCDVEYNLVERRVDSINRMNKTFDEPDDDVHPSNGGGCRRCGTAEEEMIERRKGRMKKRHVGKKGGGENGGWEGEGGGTGSREAVAATAAVGVNRRGKNSE